jgi:hypothetical protein
MVINFIEMLLEHNATEKRLLIVARPLHGQLQGRSRIDRY